MKLHLPAVKTPNRHSLVVILAVLIVAGVLAASIVHFQNQKQADARQAEKARLAQVEHDRQADAAIANNAELQKQVIQSTADKVTACNALRAANKPRTPIAIPQVCK